MWQFIAYCIVGGINTIVHFSILAGLVEFCGVRPALASAVGFFAVVLVGFFLNRRFVFAQSHSSMAMAGAKFLVMTLFVGSINTALMKILTEHFYIHYIISQCMVDVSLALVTFTGAKHWVFRRTKKHRDEPAQAASVQKTSSVQDAGPDPSKEDASAKADSGEEHPWDREGVEVFRFLETSTDESSDEQGTSSGK
jgi:putative flippase GtrA